MPKRPRTPAPAPLPRPSTNPDPMQRETRVMIAMPHLERAIPMGTVISMLSLTRAADTGIYAVQGKPIDIAREMLAEEAVEQGFSHVLFLDSDMKWPNLLIPRLLRMKVPIASALYFGRTSNLPVPHVYRYKHHDELGRAWYRPMGNEVQDFLRSLPEDHPNLACYPEHIITADAVGFGAVLIETAILRTIPKPWFSIDDGGGGEDMWFCERARDAGYTVHVDLGILCEHELRDVYVGASFFEEEWEVRGPDPLDWDTDGRLNVEIGARGHLRRKKGAGVWSPIEKRDD